ncbi:hypothetical protein [Bradyrhizobium sp. RP6]|uniref:hypothetical protein n=1 Tax=Bradyrhizobium sp. RP6 TaxID=2489596 RepID=UPI000F51DB1A|nr:hypothetical protein [Bradyrhizobium sp. RP6]RQH12701.1 hypothetical protein EHH60_14530 [Bradyrhizobium sp. RP6]
MATLFDVDGENLHLGYKNLCRAEFAAEKELVSQIDELWTTYAPYADPDFKDGFARDPDGRFWEMYIGCSLLKAGKQLLPTSERLLRGGQPDICVLEGGKKLWIEAIAPDRGVPGPDRVTELKPLNEGGGFAPVPVRQAQLRITSALWTKSNVITRYLKEGVIGKDDVRMVAIGGGRFGVQIQDNRLPLVLSSVFPIGAEYVSIDRATGEQVGQGFETSLEIAREGDPIPRTAFLDGPFGHISGIIWSRVSIGNMSRDQRPLTLVHNPRAEIAMPQKWGVWDREYVAVEADGRWTATDVLAGPENP